MVINLLVSTLHPRTDRRIRYHPVYRLRTYFRDPRLSPSSLPSDRIPQRNIVPDTALRFVGPCIACTRTLSRTETVPSSLLQSVGL